MTETETNFSATRAEYLLFERYVLQDNIILCDAKSGILVGFAVVTLLWCFDRLREGVAGGEIEGGVLLFGIPMLALFVVIVFGWRAIKPRIKRGNDYVYWGSKAFAGSEQEYIAAIGSAEPGVLAADMLRHLHIQASICREKFDNFERALIAAQFAGLLLLLVVCYRTISGIL